MAAPKGIKLTTSSSDVIVIGAGVVGASIGYHLAKSGAQVTLIDRDAPGSRTSKVSFAWINALGTRPEHYHHFSRLGVDGFSSLLEDLVERGVKPDRRRLFVIDGSKALRKAIDAVYGTGNPVQRCRNHKRKNVLSHVPDSMKDTVKATMNAAYRLDSEKGIARLEELAKMLELPHPSAAASLREGLPETFTVNRLGLPGALRRCLCTTNVIESPNSGIRRRTGRVSRWKDGSMVLRWVASALIEMEKSFRRIMGYEQLWMLKSYLDDPAESEGVAQERKAG